MKYHFVITMEVHGRGATSIPHTMDGHFSASHPMTEQEQYYAARRMGISALTEEVRKIDVNGVLKFDFEKAVVLFLRMVPELPEED